jgi:dTDP-4-dehydrorhamnose reductase
MRVLVTGVKGQLGYDVMNELKKLASAWMSMRWILPMQRHAAA